MLVFNLLLAAFLVIAATFNLSEAFGQYREYKDARGFRGFIAAITMFAGVVALVASDVEFRRAAPDFATALRLVSFGGVMTFLVGIVFSVASWRIGRHDA